MNRIPSIQQSQRLPRIGVVRLGKKDAQGRPVETGHFIIDGHAPEIRRRAQEVYGDTPVTLDITFYTEDLAEIFRVTNQRWGKSKKGIPYLMCEGNGVLAIEDEGKERECPCPYIGKECRQKAVLRFLLPKISMTGYFVLATKSENAAKTIGTALQIVLRATGGLIMRPMRLVRCEGYANIDGFKLKKYFIRPEFDEAAWRDKLRRQEERANTLKKSERADGGYGNTGKIATTTFNIPALPWREEVAITFREEDRRAEGRAKVKQKLRLHIRDPRADKALDVYVTHRFGKPAFTDLTADELFILWHDIDKGKEVVADIYALIC